MKAMDIIDRLDGLEPNQYSPEQKLRWLSILDGKIYEEVLRPRETEPKGFTEYVNGNEELLVPFPYGDDVYLKEDRIHRVSISAYGAHQINETACRGVQKGSGKSLVVVNETLLYKSRSDICAYQGGFPSSISDALGEELYSDAVAGAIRDRYYISMKDSEGKYQLFVYDMGKRLWMREDSLEVDSLYRRASTSTVLRPEGRPATRPGARYTRAGTITIRGTAYCGTPARRSLRRSERQSMSALSCRCCREAAPARR